MRQPEFEREFYVEQIDLMVARYRRVFQSWGMSWDRFFDPVLARLDGRRYFEWVFLCGLDPVLKEASGVEGKRERSEFLTESNRKRLMDICLDDDRTGFFLRNV